MQKKWRIRIPAQQFAVHSAICRPYKGEIRCLATCCQSGAASGAAERRGILKFPRRSRAGFDSIFSTDRPRHRPAWGRPGEFSALRFRRGERHSHRRYRSPDHHRLAGDGQSGSTRQCRYFSPSRKTRWWNSSPKRTDRDNGCTERPQGIGSRTGHLHLLLEPGPA